MEHKEGCSWWKDWHCCSCGLFDLLNQPEDIDKSDVLRRCHLVIPGTVIMCGEDVNYCSQECMEKANEKDSMR